MKDDTVPYHIDYLDKWVDRDRGVTAWLKIDQARIDAFAKATDDMNPLHVDPAAAAEGPFGCTVAHGFLTLALLSRFSYEENMQIEGVKYAINYGFDRVRFMTPVKVGDRIRNRPKLLSATPKGEGRWLFRTQNTVEIEGERNPALVASWLGMFIAE